MDRTEMRSRLAFYRGSLSGTDGGGDGHVHRGLPCVGWVVTLRLGEGRADAVAFGVTPWKPVIHYSLS